MYFLGPCLSFKRLHIITLIIQCNINLVLIILLLLKIFLTLLLVIWYYLSVVDVVLFFVDFLHANKSSSKKTSTLH